MTGWQTQKQMDVNYFLLTYNVHKLCRNTHSYYHNCICRYISINYML